MVGFITTKSMLASGLVSRSILANYDFIVTPTTPSTAFDIGDKAHQDPVSMYLADIFTVQANLTGMPALSLPLFRHSNGLPFGIQIMADHFNELPLLAFAETLYPSHHQ